MRTFSHFDDVGYLRRTQVNVEISKNEKQEFVQYEITVNVMDEESNLLAFESLAVIGSAMNEILFLKPRLRQELLNLLERTAGKARKENCLDQLDVMLRCAIGKFRLHIKEFLEILDLHKTNSRPPKLMAQERNSLSSTSKWDQFLFKRGQTPDS